MLLLMTDQQRWDSLGGSKRWPVETVNLDWLAKTGTVFSNAYTPSPSCVPARASLLTGQDPWNHGILGMGGGQGPMGVGFEHTLPGELSAAGFHTHSVGKNHFFPQRARNGYDSVVLDESGRKEDPGFVSDYEAWFNRNKPADVGFVDHGIGWNAHSARPYHAPEYLHQTNWTVNEALSFLERRDPTSPFFLKVSFARPHSPYDPPAAYFDRYLASETPPAAIGDWASIHDVEADAAAEDAWRGRFPVEHIHRARAGYMGSINHIDHQIGRLFHAMRKMRILDDTMILFLSDHGDMLGDHNLYRKTYGYEGSAHVPLIIRMPKPLGETRRLAPEPVTLQDIMPTILSAVGLPVPDTVDGASLLGHISPAGPDSPQEFVHGEHSTCYSTEQEMQYLTDGRWKYIWFPRLGTEQVFDLAHDPYEIHDLADSPDYAQETERWRKRLVNILAGRDAGLTRGDSLMNQQGRPYLVSPAYRRRMERCGLDWYRYRQPAVGRVPPLSGD